MALYNYSLQLGATVDLVLLIDTLRLDNVSQLEALANVCPQLLFGMFRCLFNASLRSQQFDQAFLPRLVVKTAIRGEL